MTTTWLVLLGMRVWAQEPDNSKGLQRGETTGDVSDPPAASRYALLIGINNYLDGDDRDLSYADNDAVAVASALRASGRWRDENIVVMTSGATDTSLLPMGENIWEQLGAFQERMPANATFLLFFSGHGIGDKERRNYLLPMNVKWTMPRPTGIQLHELLDFVDRLAVERRIVMLDACRDVSTDTGARDGTSDAFDSANVESTGTFVIQSSAFGKKSFEDNKRQLGQFTAAVLDALQAGDGCRELDEDTGTCMGQKDGLIDLDEVFSVATFDLKQRPVDRRQTPMRSGENSGSPLAIVPATALLPPCAQEIQNAFPSEGASDVYDWTVVDAVLRTPDDSASITVHDSRGTAVSGSSSVNGTRVSWLATEALAAGETYSSTVTAGCAKKTTTWVTDPTQGTVIDPAGLVGKSFELNLLDGRRVQDGGLGPFAAFVEPHVKPIVLRVQAADDTGLDVELLEERKGLYCPLTLGQTPIRVSWSGNPHFTSTVRDRLVSVQWNGHSMPLEDVELSGAFSDGGETIQGFALSATLDVDQMNLDLDLCAAAHCVACPSGKERCIRLATDSKRLRAADIQVDRGECP